jgi:hypothetical protein
VRPLRRTHLVLAFAAPLVISSCGGDSAANADGPYGAIVARAVPRIEQQTGLKFKTPPKVENRSKEEVRTFVMKQLSSERARTQIAGQQSAYRILGLAPDALDIAALLQRLLEEQIVGYYDPASKVLYVVEGSQPALLEQTVTHELVHALQDQYVKIDSIQASVDDADRQTAAQAVLEGQAVFEQLRMDENTGPLLKMPGGWDRIRDVIRDGQGGMPVFSSAPRAIREGLLFPYLGGADFVRRFVAHRSAEELLTDLPVSTKQILNDSAYFGETRDLPSTITLPSPTAGTVTYSNSFGEFETRLILVQHLRDDALARRAASGIDGDRYAVINTTAGDALVWSTVWDTPIDAADFFDLFTDAIRKRYELSRPEFPPGETTHTLYVAAKGQRPARNITVQLSQAGSRSLVTVTDAPVGAGALMDVGKLLVNAR